MMWCLALGGCAAPSHDDDTSMDSVEGPGSSTSATASEDTTESESAAAAAPWFALGQGEDAWSPLEPGDRLKIVRGGQGLDMFTLVVRGGDFDVPEQERPLRLDVWVDIDGYDLLPSGHFAEDLGAAVLPSSTEDGVFEYVYHPLIVPDYDLSLPTLNGLDGALGARLHVELDGAPQTLAWSIPVEIEVDDTDAGDGDGDGDVEPPPDGPRFVDVTEEVGLADTVQGPMLYAPDCPFNFGYYCHPNWSIGGAAVADYDGDGDPDIFLPEWNGPDHLFRNEGGVFVDVGPEAGFSETTKTSGSAWADVDRDGDLDLYVNAMGGSENFLYINDGVGHFVNEAMERGAAVYSTFIHQGTSVGVGDYDLDGFPDFIVDAWRRWEILPNQHHHARLLHNRGDGTFENAGSLAGVEFTGGHHPDADTPTGGPFGFGPTFVDLDDDGWTDLLLVRDFGATRIYWNRGDGTFEDGSVEAGLGGDVARFGMNGAFSDFDSDGDLDWFISDIGPDGAHGYHGGTLISNDGDRTFTFLDEHLTTTNDWQWGAEFFDYDNDGDDDLAVTNGWPTESPAYQSDRSVLHRRVEGPPGTPAFERLGPALGIDDEGQGRGLYTLDYDADGDLDVLIVQHGAQPILYRNDGGNQNDWLRVRTTGTTSTTSGLGARVSVQLQDGGRRQVRQIGAQSSFMGHGSRQAHFGLGASAGPVHEVRVFWPASGHEQVFADVEPNQVLHVIEPN